MKDSELIINALDVIFNMELKNKIVTTNNIIYRKL